MNTISKEEVYSVLSDLHSLQEKTDFHNEKLNEDVNDIVNYYVKAINECYQYSLDAIHKKHDDYHLGRTYFAKELSDKLKMALTCYTKLLSIKYDIALFDIEKD